MDSLKFGYDSLGWHFSTSSTAQTIGLGALLAIGGLTVAAKTYSFLRALLSLFVIPGKSLRSFGPKGSWALITGASDGIGKEYALQISKQGYNLLLVSRTASKLDALASEIKSRNGVQVETLAMDFAANNPSDYTAISALIAGKDVSILINNVGQSHSIPVPFVGTNSTEMNNIITINCFGTLKVTQLVLPAMIQRKRGLVLTMGSFGGQLPTPFLATYSGSKAFLQQWSTALASELAGTGVTVHFVHAHLITSAMSKVRRPSMLIPAPKPFVKATLAKIGNTGGSSNYAYSGSPYWSHGLYMWVILTFAGAYSKIALAINRNMHEKIRKAALRKQERERAKLAGEGKKTA